VIGDKAEQALSSVGRAGATAGTDGAWAWHCEGAVSDNIVTFKRQAMV
jgi:hypothetical protein